MPPKTRPQVAVDIGHGFAAASVVETTGMTIEGQPIVNDPVRLATLDQYAVLDTPAEAGFDDIVQLTCRNCAVPVALVSLVAGDRQWFKARMGFSACETDLNSSICAHALGSPDELLIIPDLTRDDRTRDNPLVTGEPFIRFYAGAPLVTPEGQVLGSLCAIDSRPRPDGLTQAQAEDLRALARQVMSQLELRRAIAARDAVRAAEARAYHAREALRDTQTAVATAGGDLDSILHAVVMGAMRAIPAAEGGVFELIDGAELEYRAVRGTLSANKGLRLPLHGTLAGHCALTRHSVLVDDEKDDPRLSNEVIRRIGQRAAIFAPVTRGDHVLGVVKLQAGDAAAFTEADLAQLELFAGVGSNGLTAAEARAEAQAKETYWRGLFDQLREGLVIGEVIRDEQGTVTDWRYLEVNPAWSELIGLPASAALGRTIREVLPGLEEDWISDPADAIAFGEPIAFTRQVGQLGRWYEGRINAIGPDSFVLLFLDVTDRILAEQAAAKASQRRMALAQLGDTLRNTMDVEAMAYTVGAIVGPVLGATQAGYAAVNAAKELVQVTSTWCTPGVTSIAGKHSFREYGSYIEDLKGGTTVAIANVGEDERTLAQVSTFAELGIVALVNVPVVEHGELVAIFLALFDAPRTLTREEVAFIQAAVDRTRVGIARVRAEERQTVLNGEISHRLKNSMAMIQGITRQTLRNVVEREPVVALEERLMALSAAHDLLLQKDWEEAELGEIVRRVLDAAGADERAKVSGPSVMLGPRAALSTSLLIHELVTNACKYGSLTAADGTVEVTWRLDGAADGEELALAWRENGGPPAVAPKRRGFGSRLLQMGLVGTGGSELAYESSGLSATFRASRKHVEQA